MTTPSNEAPIDPKLCTLKDCPNGLFVYSGSYGFKTEYKTIDRAKGTWLSDAYVLESGEYFWGGAATATERENLIVTPVAISALDRRDEPKGMKCPQCGGDADNGHDRELPPNAYTCKKCSDEPKGLKSAEEALKLTLDQIVKPVIEAKDAEIAKVQDHNKWLQSELERYQKAGCVSVSERLKNQADTICVQSAEIAKLRGVVEKMREALRLIREFVKGRYVEGERGYQVEVIALDALAALRSADEVLE